MIPPFSVIIPVRNEAAQLARTAPALKNAVTGLPAQIIYVLNATQDESASIIRATFDRQAAIIEMDRPGKAIALRAGDAASSRSIRVYLDADVWVEPDIFGNLLIPIISGQADLVAPKIRANLSDSKGLSRRVSRVWADQLDRRKDAFMCCTAFSENGLGLRGIWPTILADDDWARSQIPTDRRIIVDTAKIEISPPRDLASWLRVRARWIRGTRELRQFRTLSQPHQKVRPRGRLPDLAVYYFVRALAEPLASFQRWVGADWGRDISTRKSNHDRS